MIIDVNFLGGTESWQILVDASAIRAAQILSDPATLARIRAFPRFDDTTDTPDQIASALERAGTIPISVGFYWGLFTKAIAYEENNCVYFNTRKWAYGAGSPGNVAHELMHRLGYVHNGNSAQGNQNTVPYWIGNLVDEIIASQMKAKA